MPRVGVWLGVLLVPVVAAAEIVCALGPTSSSYNAYEDQRPSPDAMQLAGQVNAALTPICRPNCPEIAIFRNGTAPNTLLSVAGGQAKIVYAPQFFTSIYESYGDGAIVAVIAHELGHALNEISPTLWINPGWSVEVRADAWSGCALAKVNLNSRSLGEALTAVAKYPSPAHPGWPQRVPALRLGYLHCGGDAARFDAAAGGTGKKPPAR